MINLSLEVHGLDLGLIVAHGDLLEGRLERERRVYKNAIGEGNARAAGDGRIGKHQLHHLLGERVESLGLACTLVPEYGYELVAGGAASAGSDEAERDMEWDRGEGDVAGSRLRVRWDGGGEAEGESGLVRDREADICGKGGCHDRGGGSLDLW